jgi:hypothetical protein
MTNFLSSNDHDLAILFSNNYDIWNRFYGDEDYSEEKNLDIVKMFEQANEDSAKLEKLLRMWLCILDDSSSYAEDFGEREFESLSKLISDKVPHILPSRLLGPLAELFCFVTYGYDDDDDEWPAWLIPLIEACKRCSERVPHDGGYLHALDRVLCSNFRRALKANPDINNAYKAASAIANNPVDVPPVTIVRATKLLSDNIRAFPPAEDEAFIRFEPLMIFFNQQCQLATNDSVALEVLCACVADILPVATMLMKKFEQRSQATFLANGFVSSITSFAVTYCQDFSKPASFAALTSIASFVTAIAVPKGLKIPSCDDTEEMRSIFDRLCAEKQSICDMLVGGNSHFVIANALIGNDTGDHLGTANALLLSGLLALLLFAGKDKQTVLVAQLETLPKFLDCLKCHAKNQIWTYSGKWSSGIMGTTKESIVARLILACCMPIHFSAFLAKEGEESDRPRFKARRTENAGVPSTPAAVIEEALANCNGLRPRHASIDDWMLCLACL